MKYHNCLRPVSLLLALPAFAACGQAADEQPGYATVTMALTVQAEETPDGLLVEEAGGGELVLDNALAFVRDIEFDLPDGVSCSGDDDFDGECDEDSDKIVVTGPWLVDLMTGTATPPMDDIRIPAGRYKRVDVRFDDAEPAQAPGLEIPAELAGATLVADGTTSTGDAERFQLRLKFNEDARFETEDGIDVDETGTQAMLLELDASSWFASVNLSDCVEDGDLAIDDGVLMIDDEDGSCSDIENDLKRAIKESGQFDK